MVETIKIARLIWLNQQGNKTTQNSTYHVLDLNINKTHKQTHNNSSILSLYLINKNTENPRLSSRLYRL